MGCSVENPETRKANASRNAVIRSECERRFHARIGATLNGSANAMEPRICHLKIAMKKVELKERKLASGSGHLDKVRA